MTKHEEGTCESCKYYREVDSDLRTGECHRNAPHPGFFQAVLGPCQTGTDANYYAKAVWPEVDGDDGCGEWERER